MARVGLFIDDDEKLVESVKAVAENADIELLTATSWSEGLGLFLVISPDVVVADYNMPDSAHGLKLLAEIRQLRPSVRVVLISGFLTATNLRDVVERGLVDAALPKGSAIETLEQIMNEVSAVASEPDAPTDWRAFGNAFVEAKRVTERDVEEIDDILRGRAGAT